MVVWCSVVTETRGNHAVSLPLTHIKFPVLFKSFLPITPVSWGGWQWLEAANAWWAHCMKGLVEDNVKYCAHLINSCQSPQKKAAQCKDLADSWTYESKVSWGILDFVMEYVTDSLRVIHSPLAISLGFLYIVQLPSCLLKIWWDYSVWL